MRLNQSRPELIRNRPSELNETFWKLAGLTRMGMNIGNCHFSSDFQPTLLSEIVPKGTLFNLETPKPLINLIYIGKVEGQSKPRWWRDNLDWSPVCEGDMGVSMQSSAKSLNLEVTSRLIEVLLLVWLLEWLSFGRPVVMRLRNSQSPHRQLSSWGGEVDKVPKDQLFLLFTPSRSDKIDKRLTCGSRARLFGSLFDGVQLSIETLYDLLPLSLHITPVSIFVTHFSLWGLGEGNHQSDSTRLNGTARLSAWNLAFLLADQMGTEGEWKRERS